MIQETITENLASCPFCGGRAEMKVTDNPFNNGNLMVRVHCTSCHCVSTTCHTGWTMAFGDIPRRNITLEEAKADARAAWNRRPGPSSNMKYLGTERMQYISSLPFSKVTALMKAAMEAADLSKYASYEESVFCECMMKLYGCVPLESDKSNLITFLVTLFHYGRVQGIRAERARRKRGMA